MSTQVVITRQSNPLSVWSDVYFVCDTCGERVLTDNWHADAGVYPEGWGFVFRMGIRKAICPKHFVTKTVAG